MKVGVIFFHKNIEKIYKKRWINKCIDSIRNQSKKDLTFYEINYGDNAEPRLLGDSVFFHEKKENYADAMNFIISKAFEDGCDYVFNTNLDDYYSEKRIEKQLKYLEDGYDLVSSDFCYINEDDEVFHQMNITKYGSIFSNLKNNHNVIAHPSVGMSKEFWLDEDNRYDISKVPAEDLDLWKRSINKYMFYIVDEVLLFYRIHKQQESSKK
jgi:hypothetical protein